MAVIGDDSTSGRPGRLVAYLGLDPWVSQSGEDRARHRLIKQGGSITRQILVDALGWSADTLRAFAQGGHRPMRLQRRGVAVVFRPDQSPNERIP